MATMTIRTTVAFDPATVSRWDRLAKRWGTSKSETLRRALEEAERVESKPAMKKGSKREPGFDQMTPLEIFEWMDQHPQLTAEEVKQWHSEVEQSKDDYADWSEKQQRAWSSSTRIS